MVLEKLSKNRSFMIFVLPFLLGLLSVFSFQPFNIKLKFFIILAYFYFSHMYKKDQEIFIEKNLIGGIFFL